VVVDAARARKVLAVVRIVNGLLALLAPKFLLRRLGTDADHDPSGIYPFRMFGIRTVLIGADLLLLTGEESRRAGKLAVVIHASDTANAATCLVKGYLPRKAGIIATLISAGNTVLAVLATRD
jgi:uncharacterized protein YjeT (DUF2065 family)